MDKINPRVEQYRAAFAAWALTVPKLAAGLQRELMMMAGFEHEEDLTRDPGFSFSFVKIGLDQLDGAGTACGNSPNYCLGDKKVAAFLANRDLNFIVGISENAQPLLYAAAVPLSWQWARKFEYLIELAGGSLRADETDFRGWTIFESE